MAMSKQDACRKIREALPRNSRFEVRSVRGGSIVVDNPCGPVAALVGRGGTVPKGIVFTMRVNGDITSGAVREFVDEVKTKVNASFPFLSKPASQRV